MEKIKNFLSVKRRRIIAFVLLDIVVLMLSSFLAIALRYDFINIPELYIDNIYKYILIDALILIAINALFKIYLSVWTYASIMELINIGFACISYIFIEFIYKLMFKIEMPRSYYLIKVILLAFFIATIRYAYRIARTIRELRMTKKNLKNTI